MCLKLTIKHGNSLKKSIKYINDYFYSNRSIIEGNKSIAERKKKMGEKKC